METDNNSLDGGFTGSAYDSSLETPATGPVPTDPTVPSAGAPESHRPFFKIHKKRLIELGVIVTMIALSVIGGIFLFGSKHSKQLAANNSASTFAAGALSVKGISNTSPLQIGETDHLAVNGQLRVSNTLVLSPTAVPTSPVAGQIYYGKDNQLYFYNGTKFISLGGGSGTPAFNIQNQNGVLYGSATSVSSVVASATGQCLLSTSGAPVFGSCNNNVIGTPGQLAMFTGSGDSVGNSLIGQSGNAISINGSLSLSGVLSGNGSGLTNLNASNVTTGVLQLPVGGTGAVDATDARANLGAAASGTNSDITSLTDLSSITSPGALSIGSAGQTLALQGSSATTLTVANSGFTTTLGFATPTADTSITIPNSNGTVAVQATGPIELDSTGNISCPDCLVSGGGGTMGVVSVNTFSGAVSIIQGTGLNITNNSGTITVAADQDISTTAIPTFNGLVLNGSLGVGTDTPQYPVDVNGDVNSNTGFSINGNPICSSSGCTASGGSNLYIQNSTTLHAANLAIQGNGVGNSVAVIRGATGQTANILAVENSTGTTLLSVGPNGSIGIDTAAPNYPLDVNGDINTNSDLRINGTAVCLTVASVAGCTPNGGSSNYIQNGTTIQTGGANFAIQSAAAGDIGGVVQGASGQTADLFQAQANGGTEEFGVSAGGNGYFNGGVGIQTTLSGYALNVGGNGEVNAGTGLYVAGVEVCTSSGCLSSGGTGGAVLNGTSLQPSANFAIQSAAAGDIGGVIRGAASQTANLLDLQNSSGVNQFSVGPGGAAYVASSLGVGVTNPSYAVDVVGDLNITGDYRINGVPVCTSGGCSGGGGGGAFINNNTSLQTSANFNISSGATATNPTAIIQAANLQTGDLLDFNTSSGSVAAAINPSGQLRVAGATAYTTALNVGTNTTTAAGGISFGSDADLYRSGSAALKTDGSLQASELQAAGADFSTGLLLQSTTASSTRSNNLTFTDNQATPQSISLRKQGNNLVVLDNSGNVQLGFSPSTNGILFGSTLDTDLYRSGSDALTTDGALTVVGTFTNHGQAIFQNLTNGTSAFEVQNASGTNLLVGDTNDQRVGIDTTSPPAFTLDVNGDINTSGVYRVNGTPVCTSSGCVVATTSGILNQTTQQANANFNIQSAGTGDIGAVIGGISGQTADLLDLNGGNGTTVVSVGATGNTLIQPSTNSTTAFQIQNQAGTSKLLVADTTDGVIGIGMAPSSTGAALQVAGNINVGGQLVLDSTPLSSNTHLGQIIKNVLNGTGGTSVHDVVVLDSTNHVVDTTTARDSRVYGISVNGGISGTATQVAISGDYTVNATTNSGANPINVGDQLVTSTTTGDVMVDDSATSGILGTALTALASGTGTVDVAINPVRGVSTPIFSPQTDSTTAFEIQNAARSSNLFVADSTDSKIGINTTPTSTGAALQVNGNLSVSSSIILAPSNQTHAGQIVKNVTVAAGGVSANDVVVLNSSAQVADSTTARDPKVYGVSLGTYAGSAVGQMAILGNATVNATAVSTPINIGDQVVVSSTSGDVMSDNTATTGILGTALTALASGTGTVDVAIRPIGGQTNPTFRGSGDSSTVAGSGVLFENAANSTNAFEIQNAAGTGNLFVADTTDNLIGIGGAPSSTGSTLQVTGTITATNAIFTNSNFQLSTASTSGGNYGKVAIAGTGGVTINDVVVMNSSHQVVDTTTARDPRVYGVVNATAAASASVNVAIVGDFVVNATTNSGANPINIGDQLVTSTTSGDVMSDNSATSGIVGYALSALASGTGTVNVEIRPVGGQSNPIFNPQTNSTTAFQIQNAARSTTILDADTTNTSIGIAGAATNAGYALNVTGSINASGNVYSGGVQLCTVTACGSSGLSGSFIDNSTSLQAANFNIQSASASSIGGVIEGASGQTADLLDLESGTGAIVQSTSATGAVLIKTATNASTAFLINNSGNVNSLTVSTISPRVGINTEAPQLSLDIGTSTASTPGSIGVELAVLNKPTLTCNTSGGSLADGTYYYEISASDGSGFTQTNGSTAIEQSCTISGGGGAGSVSVSWTAETGAASYRVWRGTTSLGENVYYTSATNSFTDTGAAGTSGTPPTVTAAYVNKIAGSGNSYFDSGNVGIGTGTPTALLDVAGSALFQNAANSTTAFQIQNQAGTSNLLIADTTDSMIGIDVVPVSTTYQLQVGGAISATTQLVLNATSDVSLTKVETAGATVTADDVLILNSSNRVVDTTTARDPRVIGIARIGQNSGGTLGVAIAGQYTVNATGTINIGDQLVTSTTAGAVMSDNTATTGIVGIAITALAGGTGTVDVEIGVVHGETNPTFRGSGDGSTVAGSGVLFQNATDSTNAFEIQNAAGTSNLFVVNTTAGTIGIGQAPSGSAALQVTGIIAATSDIDTQTRILFNNSSNSLGNVQKSTVAGTGGVTQSDVVTLNSSAQAVDTTTARNTSVYGVANSTVTATNNVAVVISGDTIVNATAASTPINIGDQLVTSTTKGDVMSDNTATSGILGTALTALASGTGTVDVAVRPVNGVSSPIFSPQSDSTTAFQIQNAGRSTTLFDVNSTNSKIGIGAAPTSGGDTLQVTGNISTTTELDVGSNTSLSTTALTIGGNAVCNSSGCEAAGSGVGGAILNGSTLQTGANFAIQSAGTGKVGGLIEGISGQTADLLDLQSDPSGTGVNVFTAGNTGNILIKPSTTSVTALQVQNAGSTSVLDVDSTNNQVGINTNAPGAILDVEDQNAYSGNANVALNVVGGTGNSAGGGTGGTINLQGGVGGSTGGGLGGGITLTAGAGGVTGAGDGGNVNINGGAGGGAGNGGNVNINGGSGGGAGTGGVNITAATNGAVAINGSSVNIDTLSSGGAVTVGSTNNTAALIFGQSTQTDTIQIGAAQTAANKTQTIQIGTSATSNGKDLITIGNTNAASSLTLDAGTGGVTLDSGSAGVLVQGTNSTTAFQIQNAAASTTLLDADTTNLKLAVTGYTSITGGLTDSGLATPSAPTVTNVGATGSGHYTYAIAALNANSGTTLPSTGTQTLTGNATLTGTNFNQITWTGVVGATSYNIYRTGVTNGSPSATGLIGNVLATSTLSFNDTGVCTSGCSAVPTVDTSGQFTDTGTALFKNASNSTTAFQIQSSGGTALLTASTSALSVTVSGELLTSGNVAAIIGPTELVTTSEEFPASGTAGWTSNFTSCPSTCGQSATATHTSGTTAVSLTPALSLTSGKTYQVTFTTSGTTSPGDSITPSVGGASGEPIYGNDTTEVQAIVSGGGNLSFTPTTGWTGTISAVSVKLITTASASLSVAGTPFYSTNSTNIYEGSQTGNLSSGSNGNVGIGSFAEQSIITGGNDVALGYQALQAATTSSNNTAIGESALSFITTGHDNTGLGYQAGVTNTSTNANITGSGNTFLGDNAGPGSVTQLQNSTAIGIASVVTASNSLVLGCTSGTNGCTTSTNIGIGTTAPANLLSIGALNNTTNTGTSQLAVSIPGTSNSGIVVEESGTPTSGYYLQAQTSAGALLASIDYQGNLSVKAATINGTLTVDGHIISGNSSGSTSAAPQAGALGSTGTCVLNPASFAAGNDTSGTIVLTPGGSGIASGIQCIVTFGSAYATFPHVVITPGNAASQALGVFGAGTATTTFNVGFATAGTTGVPYTYNYFIAQ